MGKKGFKYFIGYKDVKKIYIPLCIFLPKMNSYKRVFDETKYMSFFDKKWWIIRKMWWNIRKNQQEHQKRICEPIYNEKYLKTKIKSYNGKINTNFDNNKILKEGWISTYQ